MMQNMIVLWKELTSRVKTWDAGKVLVYAFTLHQLLSIVQTVMENYSVSGEIQDISGV